MTDLNDSNATVLWTVARCGLDRIDTIIFLFAEKKNVTNLAGILSGKEAEKQDIHLDVLLFIYTIFPSGLMVTIFRGICFPQLSRAVFTA